MQGQNGNKIWRSLEELSGSKDLEAARHREFAPGVVDKGFNRRAFLKVMGASLALAGLPACTRQPITKIVPYVKQPEELIPGKPMYFATAATFMGFGLGLLAESHEGHPTKVEGNAGHPASLGATTVFQQAALLDLYDPDRSQAVLQDLQPAAWDDFVAAIFDAMQSQVRKNGSGVRILTETVTSPTLESQIRQLLKTYPEAQWHHYEPVNRDSVYDGSKLAFGEFVETQFHFDKAQVVVSLDSDFLYWHPFSVRYARDFASLRRARFPEKDMNRLYVLETSPTVTGSNADNHFAMRTGEIQDAAFALARHLGMALPVDLARENKSEPPWIATMAADLLQNRGKSIVIAGESQPPAVHALVHFINDFLGNTGRTLTYTDTAEANPGNRMNSFRDLVGDLKMGKVDVLIMLGGNPVFNAPADFEFSDYIFKAKFRVHLAPEVDETSALSHWHIPENHFLESWGDVRAFDGTASIVQPLILPLYAGKSATELMDAVLQPPGRADYDIVRGFWQSEDSSPGFEDRWRRALHDGYITGTALPPKKVKVGSLDSLGSHKPTQETGPGIEITFRPDPTIFDGRHANNGFLQELPKPIHKLTWDNAALVSPKLAAREGLANGDMVEIAFQSRTLELPIWITPGQPENSIGLQFGYGRSCVGAVGQDTGFNVYQLRASNAMWSGDRAGFKKTDRRYQLVTTQHQHVIDSPERQIIREGTFADFQNDPKFVQKDSAAPAELDTLFRPSEYPYKGYKWGMAIDLTACIGCNACIIACQVENNIPVIGKHEVQMGRIMHWIRVDSYFRGDPDNPGITHQPVPCMQCEDAPCELVCPVGATLTDSEGINLQVYNRCIGTRYCSNNCPWKVRRFNFLQYANYNAPSLKPMWNPDVTVRWRGVMEKCTYCLQRISEARIRSENENRQIRAGEIQTACQQVCPANAIVFGDYNNEESQVKKLKSHPLNYFMLGQLNTRPRTFYLAKLRNPNPKIPA